MPSESPLAPETSGGVASAEFGLVMLDGPAGVAVAMTPEAAEETGLSLLAAAEAAAGQRARGETGY
ncbi:hypothetical protein ACNFJ7_03785 [Sphingomonas sp. HT-1]|uniref:hypothetical protein n=1 Tax=unclassified Sphingomonas TaxID=196159 RepID=UPI0002E72084|nr:MULTISPECIES: hypothetical protein [unclassified Sphingomonas]KTF69247.1 hypothetical protein ATB93_10320 [Sphingomonas sp. WG]